MSSTKMDLWYSGASDLKPNLATIKRYLIKKLGACCSECGWSEINPWSGQVALSLDHVDGDHSNFSPFNFRLLCPNCHALTPTYAGLNHRVNRQGPYKKIIDKLDIPEYDDLVVVEV